LVAQLIKLAIVSWTLAFSLRLLLQDRYSWLVLVDLDGQLRILLLVLVDCHVQLADLALREWKLLSQLIDPNVELVDLTLILLLYGSSVIGLVSLLTQLTDLGFVPRDLLGQLGNPDVQLVDDGLALVVLQLPFVWKVGLVAFGLQREDPFIKGSDFSIFLGQQSTESFELNPARDVSPFVLEQETQTIDLLSQESILRDKRRIILNNFGTKIT
jgi:hypothetical protein